MVDVVGANCGWSGYDVFDLFLQFVLYFLELALDTFQSPASNFLVLAQVLGATLCVCDDGMVFGYGGEFTLGTCAGGLVPYLIGACMVTGSTEAISLGTYIIDA